MEEKKLRQVRALKNISEVGKMSTILIVDDDLDFNSCICQLAEQKSCRAISATTKAEAQKIAQTVKPDLIVIGTITPRGDAFLLHQWMKQRSSLSLLPMIIIDAHPEQRMVKGWRRDEGLRMESDDYLVKPVDPDALICLVEKLVDRGTTEKIRVLVVDDQAVVRDAIRALIATQKDMVVVGEASDGSEAVEKVRQYAPDIVLMDIVMPVMNGLKATKMISDERQDTKVLMLSQYDDEDNIRESDKVGAFGFIAKSSANTELLSAIRSAS